mmetsp:Transcript_28828/g.112322  ORF Transcript_28828/g.112322 Transcript_28828/m.112322 type:complete len:107 (-) Transcript_28828:650-970(-)
MRRKVRLTAAREVTCHAGKREQVPVDCPSGSYARLLSQARRSSAERHVLLTLPVAQFVLPVDPVAFTYLARTLGSIVRYVQKVSIASGMNISCGFCVGHRLRSGPA